MLAIETTMIINNIVLKPLNGHIHQPQRDMDIFGDCARFCIPEYATMQLEFLFNNYDEEYATLNFLLDTFHYHNNLYTLGTGKVCQYCGHYNPTGKINCHRCNGKLDIVDFVKPQKLDIHIVSNSRAGQSLLDEQHRMSIEFSSPNPKDFSALMSNQIYALQSNFSLFPNCYMCAYCGTLIEHNKDCPNCGGTRIPLHEITDIKRECLYCGNTTHGELVCNRCGAHLEAKILADTIRSYSNAESRI